MMFFECMVGKIVPCMCACKACNWKRKDSLIALVRESAYFQSKGGGQKESVFGVKYLDTAHRGQTER